MGPSLVFYGSAHPKEGPMEGNPKARKVPAQDRLPCSRHFLGGGGSLFQHGCVLAFVVRAARAGKARQCHSIQSPSSFNPEPTATVTALASHRRRWLRVKRSIHSRLRKHW